MSPRDRLRRWRFAQSSRRVVRPGEFASFGEGTVVHPPFACSDRGRVSVGARTYLLPDAQLVLGPHGRIAIGERCYLGRDMTIVACGEVVIGDGVMSVDRVVICDVDVPPGGPREPVGDPRPVRVGDGAFIGTGAVLLPGVTIGTRACVGALAVVTESVPDHTMVAGNPARVVRRYDAVAGEWVSA